MTLKYFDISSERKYYQLTKALDPRLRQQIAEDYARITGVHPHKVVVFALTTPEDFSTVLLPPFYQLKPTEQAAIIMHEALWLRPNATYEKVMTGEQITQAYLEDKTSPEKFMRFVELIASFTKDSELKLRAGFYFDLKNQRLPANVLSSQKMLLKDFLGEKYIRNTLCPSHLEADPYGKASRELYFDLRFNYELRAKSLFYAGLFDFLGERGEMTFGASFVDCKNSQALVNMVETLTVDLSALINSDSGSLLVLDADGNEFGHLSYRKGTP